MHKYDKALHHHIYRMVRTKGEVEDLVQESFIKAFSALTSYSSDYAFSTWLYKIATNHTIDYLRKKKLPTFSLETEVRFSSQQDMHAFAKDLSRAVARLVTRYHDETASKGRRFRFFLGGHPKPRQTARKRRSEESRS